MSQFSRILRHPLFGIVILLLPGNIMHVGSCLAQTIEASLTLSATTFPAHCPILVDLTLTNSGSQEYCINLSDPVVATKGFSIEVAGKEGEYQEYDGGWHYQHSVYEKGRNPNNLRILPGMQKTWRAEFPYNRTNRPKIFHGLEPGEYRIRARFTWYPLEGGSQFIVSPDVSVKIQAYTLSDERLHTLIKSRPIKVDELFSEIESNPDSAYGQHILRWLAWGSEKLISDITFLPDIPEGKRDIQWALRSRDLQRKSFPQSRDIPEGLINEAMVRLKTGEVDKAAALLEQLVHNHPNTNEAARGSAMLTEVQTLSSEAAGNTTGQMLNKAQKIIDKTGFNKPREERISE